ncbi:hypothetical protein HDK77DRAFT_66492 [Phyllosticta capitalensis]
MGFSGSHVSFQGKPVAQAAASIVHPYAALPCLPFGVWCSIALLSIGSPSSFFAARVVCPIDSATSSATGALPLFSLFTFCLLIFSLPWRSAALVGALGAPIYSRICMQVPHPRHRPQLGSTRKTSWFVCAKRSKELRKPEL